MAETIAKYKNVPGRPLLHFCVHYNNSSILQAISNNSMSSSMFL